MASRELTGRGSLRGRHGIFGVRPLHLSGGVVGEGQDFYRVDPPGECPVTGGDLPFVSLFTSIANGSGKGDNRGHNRSFLRLLRRS